MASTSPALDDALTGGEGRRLAPTFTCLSLSLSLSLAARSLSPAHFYARFNLLKIARSFDLLQLYMLLLLHSFSISLLSFR